MFEFVRFKPGDIGKLRSRVSDDYAVDLLSEPQMGKEIVESKYSYSAKYNGDVIAIGAFQELWPGRAVGWSVFVDDITHSEFVYVHKQVLSLLEGFESEYGRIEMTVVDGFEAGNRWAALLGFELEAVMLNYGPDGSTHRMYVRIRS